MGKTGSIEWVRVRGRKGKTIKVKKAAQSKSHPGPGQRYTSSGSKRRFKQRPARAIVK
ncbi:DUF5350 domain-containing protein [Methanosalsum natronophilum]|uniref:DUF5350 domain-containing protein n=1 Tax=Methanosalsum natronophilum TaxID=768733 RepID=UPI002167FF51|nr:DUF5350 domain-containing protein [Methanosalsum natronophilum]MCS3923677.1 hypothetical protein [Methanosalsum natronophilum]